MIHRYDAVFFDAGMTILMPSTPIAEVYLGRARKIGVRIDESEFLRHMSAMWKVVNEKYRSATADLSSSDDIERESWRLFTLECARPFPDLHRKHAEWLALLVEHFDHPDGWVLADGAAELVAKLRARGRKVGVVSNWHSALHGILLGHEFRDAFDFVLTSAEAGRKKPHREIFEKALSLSGSAPERTVHVGDSPFDDAHGAMSMGIAPILLAPTGHEAADPRIRVVQNLRDLLEDLSAP